MLLEMQGGSRIFEVVYSTSLMQLTHDRDITTKRIKLRDTWLTQLSNQLLILPQVMISWLMGSSPMLSSVLTIRNLLGILSLSFSHSQNKQINFLKIKKKRIKLKDTSFKPVKGKMTNKNIIIHSNRCQKTGNEGEKQYNNQ